MTGDEFNSIMIQRLGFTLTRWPGAKPGDISAKARDLMGESQVPIRCLREATRADWIAFQNVAAEIYCKPTRFFPGETFCVEAID
jgi:hypothetical protein